MADIHFEIFDNADFGNKNLRFSEAPAQEQRDFLKQNGYGFTTRYGGVWYPRTKEAKDRNTDFVKEFAEKFYPESNQSQPQNQIERLAESALENGSIEIKASIDNRIAYLENLIAELKEERKRDQEKISRLEAAFENQTEENIAELEMRQEQAELDDEIELEKENTLTEAEEREYLEKQSEIKIPAETIKLTSEILDFLHEAAEKESLADEPQAEKEILHDSEKSVDNNLTVSPKELAIAKSVLPTVQYVSTLKFAQGEEREFFVNKIKEIAVAVENAPKINATDGLEEHRIVLRYFHPSGTQSFITEIGKDGDAFGFQCLNDDWDNAEWGYINIDELKNIRGMEVDFHVPAGMTVERFLYKEAPEQFPKYAKFTNKENAPAQNKKSPFDVAMETGNDIEAIAAQLKTYHTLKEEDVKDLEIISDEDFSDIVDSIILNDYRHIPNIIRLPNLNAELCEKLGLAKDSAFVMKKSTTHIRPNRKGNYEQAFDTEEYRLIPQVIREANFVLVDKRTQNFQVVFDDKDNISKINKIVFNKDELGNYIVTIGKVDRRDGISEKDNTVVGVGVAPTISALRFPEEQPATRLRPSPTTVNQNIPQTEEKSSLEELSSANETRITWDDILQAAEGSHWNDSANAVYNNARNQIAEYAKNLGVDIENSESPEEVIGTFAAAHEEISFSKDGSLLIDKSLKPVYFNNLTDEQKDGYRSADDQQMLEEDTYINSDEFISKFGDWNKANRLEKLRKADLIEKNEKIILNGNDITSTVASLIENEDRKGLQSLEKEIGRTILGTYQNDDTGIFVNVSNRNVTEISNHHYFFKEHIQSLAYIPEIIEKATFIAEVENEDKKKHPNIEKYLYFGTGLKLSGEDYTCKSVIGVDSSKNCYYDQSLSSIEKGSLVDYVMQNKKAGNLSPLMTQRETDLEGNEMPYVYYDKRLISVCQVPQLPYMEKLNEVWKPTKEAIELVKAGRLHIEKNGQEYVIIQANNETPVSELSATEASKQNFSKEQAATNFVLEKLKSAGIEVITDKEEFDRIIQREEFLQRMSKNISSENEKSWKESYFLFNEEDVENYTRQIAEWQKNNINVAKLIEVGQIPPIMKVLGIADKPIEVQYSTLNKIIREESIYPNDKQGHNLSIDDIYAIPSQLADPVMVFKSRTRNDSYVFFTERKDSEDRSILIPLAVNKKKGKIIINEITSMYGRNNEIEFVKTNIEDENLIYVDKKRSLDWELSSQVQFPTQRFSYPNSEKSFNGERYTKLQLLGQRFTDIETYNLNILTKERLVNFISAGQSQTLQKMSVSDGETYGFAYNGKIYLNPDVMNSNSAVHEYTHLWDEYTKNTNSELWQKGKDIFKETHFWEEVRNDPNYSDIADDDDLVLSEIHARICGDLAQKVLEHIAETDGEITKEKAIDWNAETAAYILDLYKKAQPENELIQNMDASEVKKEIVEFLSMPMKDLMAGKNISVSLSEEKALSGKDLEEYNYYKERVKLPKSSQKKIREQCREILKKSDSEITEADKKILSQYEGGGGLNENNRTNSEVLNAFYTPDNLIEKVWELVDAYAPDAKTVLEPSAGVGKFANNRPDNKFTMHELNETSARINKILHPEADVIQGAFQKQFLDDGERFLKIGYEQPKHDVVIGNPPYGKYNDKYKGLGEGREFDRYEEYFIARGLEALKDEKSVLAFVVPSGFLNTVSDKQKSIIASKGEILDAYRLPEGTFSTTEVGTDILIMRKKESLDDRKNISGELLSDGEWFKNHPEKILGEIKTRTNRFGKEEEYVAVHEGLSVQDELNKIDSFVDEIKKANQTEKLKDPLPEYSSDEENTEIISSPEIFTDEFAENITKFKKSLNNYFEKGIRPENDRFVIGKTPLVLQKTGSDVTEVTVPVSVIKKALETHGLSQDEIFSSLAKMYNPVLVFDSDKNATENKVNSKLILTDVFKDENPVALAVNTNSTIDINNRGLTVEVQDIRSIHDRNVVAKNGTDLIQKWTNDGLCRYVNDKKITDWSTVARVQFPVELLQSDNSNILTRTALVNSISSEQIPLEENKKTEPEKQNSTSPKARKEKWNISKSKGDVMTAEEFSHLYGRDFDEREFPIWKATDWQGNIDLSKLSGDDIQYLSESGKYVEKNFGEWTHKELFTSGDIYAKIQEQRELYVKSDGNKIFADNIKLLESAMKSPLEIEKIHFGVKTALAESFKIEHIDAEGNKVNLNLQESFILWAQNAKLADRKWRGDVDFAIANISREELGEELSFYDIVNYIDGKPVKAEAVRGWRTYDMSEEEKAAEKAERRKEADLKRQARSDTANRLFDRYLHEGLSESDTKRLSAEYNRRFNSYVAPDYSKLPLFVDGMSAYKGDSKFKLYDQQIKGISFLCNKGNGLLAYDVGVGKTAAGIVATVNQIQTGRSKRPLIIVPNQVYSKWYTDIRQLFPNIKVNDLYNFGKDSVEKYIDSENLHRLNIPENSISLCTYEALKNITFTDESCENELYEDFASLLSADMDGSARNNAESSDKIKGIIGSASHVKDESYFFYEDCGFDNLTVDEAHNFKNLWVVPRPKKKGESNEYAGIPSGKPSARALKMYGMTQLTQRHNDDRNVFMLTATPFTNSPTEVYSMLSYVGRERLKQAGITSLRAFFDEFAQTKQELGVTSTGNIDTKQVMKSWKELSALQNILTEFIDKVDGEEAGIIRPNKFTHVKPLDMSDLQKEMREIDEDRMAEVKEGNSAAVIVAMNNMRLSCVAPALANPEMYPGVELPPLSKLVETSPKLKFVCDAIIDMYKGNPEKGQFMYVPLGKESHGIIKDYLVAHGIPKNAVEIINGEVNNTPEKKEKITSCFNDEKNPYKIIIGGRNTAEGIDLNGNSFSMYNCSLGWNPSETIQAEGRIWRQGNLQGNVHIVYPVMNDSIDSVLYQKHDEKRSRINELWNYKGDSLNVEDINPEDLKLDLIKDPNKKAKLILQEETKEARAELSRLNLKIKSFDEIIEKRKQFELDFSDAKEIVDYQKKQIESYKESGLEVPEWIKSEFKDCNKKFSKAETGLEKVNEKLSSLKITDSEKEAEYIHSLNNQKHACEEKINNIENTLPQILKKLEIERMEQKLIEYPVEKQREILEADILNNLRPMKEVEYEIKTMRHEAMLSEKLKAGEISEEEFSLYKNAGYEKYEKWLNGEIESLEENTVKNESTKENSSIKNETDIEKIIVYYDGHWADERGEKGKGWKYQEKSFDNPKDALDFYRTAKIPKDVGAENKNGFRFNFMNPEERLLKMISEQDKTVSVKNENVSENAAVEKPEQKDLKKAAEKAEPAKQPEQNMDSLYSDSGSLFFGFDDSDILSVHSPENEYRKSAPYDDFSITERQLTESELKRDEIIFPVLNGKESGMYKAFKDFAEHGVFDVQGKSVELDDSGRISETGWNQLQAAMEIYRNKQFETFRYVLIGREDGEIKDQLAVKSYSPNSCAVSTPDLQTIKQVITRAEELDCMVAAVHNHPSGNTVESSFDTELTESLKRNLTNGNGLCRFAGHIILDHDTFNLYTPENGWKMKLNSNAYGNTEDNLVNRNFAFLKDSVDYTWQLENVAKKINDKNNWNDNFIPVVFADSLNHVSGIKLYDKSFFDNEPQKIRNELQFSGLEANSVKAFPVITKNFAETMSAVDELLFEDKLKNLVKHSAFIDAALPESTVTEKFNILPGRQYFDVHGAKMRNPDIEATWQTRINPALFSEPEQRTMRKKEVAFER